MTAKIANIENRNLRFHSRGAVAERHAAAFRIFFPAPSSESCSCCKASAAESGRGLHSRKYFCFFFFFGYVGLLSTATEVSKMSTTVMKDNLKFQKKLNLYEAVIGTVFRPLFHGNVLPDALHSFGSSTLFFPRRRRIAISGCSCLKTA